MIDAPAYDPAKLAALRAAAEEHYAASESGDWARYEESSRAYMDARDACGPAEIAEWIADCPF